MPTNADDSENINLTGYSAGGDPNHDDPDYDGLVDYVPASDDPDHCGPDYCDPDYCDPDHCVPDHCGPNHDPSWGNAGLRLGEANIHFRVCIYRFGLI